MSEVARRKRKPPRGLPAVIEQRDRKPLIFGWGAHLNRQEREALKERIALFVGIGLAAVLLLVIGWGWYQDNVAGPAATTAENNKPVAVVGNATITNGFFKRFESFELTQINSQLTQIQQGLSQAQTLGKKANGQVAQLQAQQSQLQQQLTTLPQNTETQLIDEQTILQRASKAGVVASPKAIDAQMNKLVVNYGGPAHFQQFLASTALTRGELQGQVEATYLKTKLQKKLSAQTARSQVKVRASHILVKSKSLAEKLYKKLLAGASFAAFAKKYSIDKSNSAKGGDLGYNRRHVMVPAFDNAMFSMKVGQLRVVHTQFGWHIIKVTGHRYTTLKPSEYQQAQQSAFNTWLLSQQNIIGVKRINAAPVVPGIPTPSPFQGTNGQIPGQQVPGQQVPGQVRNGAPSHLVPPPSTLKSGIKPKTKGKTK